MIRKLAIAAAAAATLMLLGGSAQADNTDQSLHQQCAELIWAEGGRVVTAEGDRAPASLAELQRLPLHCPELGTNELLHPDGH